jgi:predicted small secreted protein
MSGMQKRTVLVIVCVVSVLVSAACHTVRGVGQDTQAAGRGIERAAK